MLASELEQLKPNTNVHVHIQDLDYIDHACIDLLTNWDRQHKTTGGSLEIGWDDLTQKYKNRTAAAFRAAQAARNGS
jgi:ABC-type transporter Mla MlaB component